MYSARLTISAFASCLALGLAGPAYAATTLGQSGPGVQADSCQNGTEFMQYHRTDGTSYAAPADGVLTSWTFQAGSQLTQLSLRVYRGSGFTFTTVADHGRLEAVLPNTARTFPTRLTVRAGDRIGARVLSGGCTIASGSSGDVLLFNPGPLTPVGATADYASGPGSFALAVAARFELDADRDGYGDESQDLCPLSAKTQGACPAPDTTVKRARTTRAKTRIAFSASIAGSTFVCSLDGRKPRACHSPATYRCLSSGRHTLSVAASSPLGIVDPSPAVRTFKVSNKRKAC